MDLGMEFDSDVGPTLFFLSKYSSWPKLAFDTMEIILSVLEMCSFF